MKINEQIKSFYQNNKSKALAIVTIIVIGGFIITYWSVEATSTPEFCIKCHEIKPQYDTWKLSTHYNPTKENINVISTEIATCRNCHLPPWNRPVSLIWSKAYHGSKDIYHHYKDKEEFKYPGYYYKMRVDARKNLPDYNCLTCHKDILNSKAPEIKLYHKDLQPNKNVKCVDCHKNLVHK